MRFALVPPASRARFLQEAGRDRTSRLGEPEEAIRRHQPGDERQQRLDVAPLVEDVGGEQDGKDGAGAFQEVKVRTAPVET